MSERSAYSHDSLRRLVAPRSIAVIGASPTPRSLGARTLANLERFTGAVFPVNAKYEIVGRHRCFPDIASLPETPDCAILAIAKEGVEAALQACAQRGVGGAVIYASGYAETGNEQARQAQERLAAIGQAGGVRVVGPNCAGIAAHRDGAHAAFAEFLTALNANRPGVGLISQSGALGLALSQIATQGTAVSHVLSCGNSCDVDVADFVSYLADDPACGAIALVFEGLASPARLLAAAQHANSRGKAVVACKIATSVAGAAAARYHTATATGDTPALAGLMARAGIVAVSRVETLVETAAFFGKAPPSRSGGIAVVSSSGGTGIIAADTAERLGVPMPQPSAPTAALLKAAIPDFGAARNPCDATAQATSNAQSFLDCVAAMLADPGYAAVVLPLGRTMAASTLAPVGALARAAGKAVCVVWMNQAIGDNGASDIAADPDLALFRSMDSCFHALAAWLNRK